MEKNNIKVYPQWYARGTPIARSRDGPAVANGATPPFAAGNGPPDNVKIDADRSIDAVGSEEAAVHFDLSAYAVPDNVKMEWDNVKMVMDNVKMVDEERSVVSVSVEAAVKFDADRSIDAVRSEERSAVRSGEAAVHFDLSACVAPDNVKMLEDERSAVDVDADKIDADRSMDAVRSGEAAVHFDLSACAAPDNVKMRDDNVKMGKNVPQLMTLTGLGTLSGLGRIDNVKIQ